MSVLKLELEIEAEIDALSVELCAVQERGDVPVSDQLPVFSKWLGANKTGLERLKKAESREKFEREMRMVKQLAAEADALTHNLRGF